ncbi:MAG: hypothetical protein U0694_06460 [Anaerolineae bacterium]
MVIFPAARDRWHDTRRHREAPLSQHIPRCRPFTSTAASATRLQEAPDSGILIQTPQGAGTINLVVNEVEITLGSTAYMTAGDGEMTVSLIEGAGNGQRLWCDGDTASGNALAFH